MKSPALRSGQGHRAKKYSGDEVAINEISNQEGYTKQYLPTAQKTIKEHGGVYVAAGPGTQIDRFFPKGRVVILRWESMEALNGWRHSPEYEAIRKVGKTSPSTMSSL
jgi:uncharacterized protein (DUF1330 family)